MKIIDPKTSQESDPDGLASLWKPALWALIITTLICVFVWATATSHVEENVNKQIEILTEPVYVPKYDSLTQSIIDSIEIGRKISHDRIDDYYDDELQNVLDTVFNAPVD